MVKNGIVIGIVAAIPIVLPNRKSDIMVEEINIIDKILYLVTPFVTFGGILLLVNYKKILPAFLKPVLERKYKRTIIILKGEINEKQSKKVYDILFSKKLKYRNIDIVIDSPGGNVFDSMLISRMIKEYKRGAVKAIIPKCAMSGGSLIALSCSSIHMTPYSVIGPIDPQLGWIFQGWNAVKSWEETVKFKKHRVEDATYAFYKTGKKVEKSLRNWIEYLIQNKSHKPKKLARFLTDGHVEHIYQINYSEAARIGLKVYTKIPKNYERLI